jgi:hypothetical protein
MHKLTQEQWQWLWLQAEEATALNRLPIRDWLFEQITHAGFDVQDRCCDSARRQPRSRQ